MSYTPVRSGVGVHDASRGNTYRHTLFTVDGGENMCSCKQTLLPRSWKGNNSKEVSQLCYLMASASLLNDWLLSMVSEVGYPHPHPNLHTSEVGHKQMLTPYVYWLQNLLTSEIAREPITHTLHLLAKLTSLRWQSACVFEFAFATFTACCYGFVSMHCLPLICLQRGGERHLGLVLCAERPSMSQPYQPKSQALTERVTVAQGQCKATPTTWPSAAHLQAVLDPEVTSQGHHSSSRTHLNRLGFGSRRHCLRCVS